MGKITLRVLFGDSTADATRISPSKTVGKSLCTLFLQKRHQRYIIIVTFFFNVQYPIDPAVISLMTVNRQYLLCVLRPEVRYETRAAIG